MTICISRCKQAGRVLAMAACALAVLAADAAVAWAQPSMTVSHAGGGAGDTFDLGRVRATGSFGDTFNVANTGDADTTTFSITLSDPLNFSLMNDPTSLAMGTNVDVTVNCHPTGAGDLTTTVTVAWSLPAASEVTFPVTCFAPALWIDEPDPYDFGDQEVGTTSTGDAITVINDTIGSLTVNDVTYSGTDCGDFADGLTDPVVLAAGASTDIDVTFSPGARGGRGLCEMTIDDTSGISDNTIDLMGNGTGAVLSLSTNTLSFGPVRVGTPSIMSFTIENTGDLDLDIQDITVGGLHPDDFVPDVTSATIAPGGSQVVNVTFTPDAIELREATITVDANEPSNLDDSVTVNGTGTLPQLVPNPSSVDFGSVRINGSTFADASVDLDNPGNQAATVSGIVFFEGQSGDYSFLSTVPGDDISIAAGGSSQVDMRCNPSAIGPRDTTLRVTSDVPGSPHDVALSCTGVRSDITVSSTGPLEFNDVLIGDTATIAYTISNWNDIHAATLNVTLSTSGGVFATSIPSITDLAPGGSQVFNVECQPTAEDDYVGTMTISHDDPTVPPLAVTLNCSGVKPEITKVLPVGANIDFGDVQVGTTSGTRTVRLRNDGSSDLVISSVIRTTGQTTEFAHANPGLLPFTIAPGNTADWTVTCSPDTADPKQTRLRFANNDSDEDPLDVILDCNGVQAQLNITPTPVAFGDVRYCENDTVDVTFENGGGADLTVNGITLSRSEYQVVAGPSTPFTIAPGNNEVLTIRFEPAGGGNADGTMTVTSTDPNSPRTVSLNGDGVVAGMGINANTHDFGDVRIDQAFPTQVFTITNVDTADFTLMSMAFTSATTDFVIEPITTLPVVLGPTQTAQFRVRATPGSVGPKSATVQINSNIPSPPCGMAPLTVAVDAEGVVPTGDFQPSSVDFGPQDIQAGPESQNITIMNTGTAPLEVSDLQLGGTDAGRYTVTASSLPFTVPVASSATVQVTYTPILVSGGDDAMLTLVTDAQNGMSVDIPLAGRGIDRDIVPSVTALNFPETYRNADDPPQLSFDINNMGEAVLSISMVTKNGGGEAAFTLVDNLDATIAGLSSDTVIVEFDPSAAGEFSATLVIANDDDQRPMVEIDLAGRGRIPNFMPERGEYDMTQGECDLSSPNPRGCIGVGIPTRLTAAFPEGIRFTNLEPQAFQVRQLRLVDSAGVEVPDTLFQIVNFQSVDVGPNQVYTVDVEFTAPEPGEYFARLEVYLGNDPDVVQFVEIQATAVEVRLRGGGCDAGDGGAGLGIGILLLAGLALVRRQRLARPARALSIALLVLALPATAAADRTRNLDLTTFRPMPGVESEMLTVEGPQVGESGAWFLGVFLNHAVNPLNLESPQIVGLEDSLVGARTAFDLGFSYAFGGRFEAGLVVPLLGQSGTDSMVVRGVPAASGLSLGDVALHGKASLLDSSIFDLGASATVTVPTAADEEFAGVDGPTAHVRAIAGLSLLDRVRFLANAGFRMRGTGEFGDLEQGHEATYGLGLSYRAMAPLWVVGELYGAFGMSGGGSTQGASPLETSLGARYRINREVSVAGGVGVGILNGVGAADFRGIAFVSYAPRAREMTAFRIIRRGPAVDEGDDDADGIANAKDECPSEPEDIDSFQDTDGCPDPDNDGDGLPDGSDPCPLESEDKDGYKDDDGCPDLDNDEDGIPDASDKCPDVPEDKDGFQDRDGCDDPDNDTDGIPDVIDQCALEPETINGKNDDDGCPDAGESLVMVMPDRIEVFEPIRFVRSSDRINKKSHNVLGQVAATLRANRSFLRIRIAVHVHPRGSKDLQITQKRAISIRKWLTQWGIEPERLEVKGFGSARPLVPKSKRGAAKVNDRVEFIILEKKVKK